MKTKDEYAEYLTEVRQVFELIKRNDLIKAQDAALTEWLRDLSQGDATAKAWMVATLCVLRANGIDIKKKGE